MGFGRLRRFALNVFARLAQGFERCLAIAPLLFLLGDHSAVTVPLLHGALLFARQTLQFQPRH